MKAIPDLYPLVGSIVQPTSMAVGRFIADRPQGITVHYTADRDSERSRRALKERGLGYHVLIERDGTVVQLTYMTRRVNHAGPSLWRELSCNKWHVAIALVSWGRLDDKRRAWNGESIVADQCAQRPENISGRLAWWDAATDVQVRRLLEVIRWCLAFGIPPENVCGHDEAAIPAGRKVDPGGVLPMTMAELRQVLLGGTKP